jgi:prepilin-type N-terminal cleavage/methylation domain-containing protein
MNARGFSMIELLVVILITGMLLAFMVPAFSRYRASLRAKQAVAQLTRDLRGARQRAITGRTPVVVVFGNGTSTTNITGYTIHTDTNGDRIFQSGELRTTHSLPTEARLGTVTLAPTDSLIFDINGVLWPGTSGGALTLIAGAAHDTLDVSAAGMVYQR